MLVPASPDKLKVGDRVFVPFIRGVTLPYRRWGLITVISDCRRFVRVELRYGRVIKDVALEAKDLHIMEEETAKRPPS